MARIARSASSDRITHEIRIDDVEIISMFTPSAASASNMSAATPGFDLIPAPTSESLAMPSSVSYRTAPTSVTIPESTASTRGRSARGSVNERSVRPSWETFCTIMSTWIPSAAIALKIAAAIPGGPAPRRG